MTTCHSLSLYLSYDPEQMQECNNFEHIMNYGNSSSILLQQSSMRIITIITTIAIIHPEQELKAFSVVSTQKMNIVNTYLSYVSPVVSSPPGASRKMRALSARERDK